MIITPENTIIVSRRAIEFWSPKKKIYFNFGGNATRVGTNCGCCWPKEVHFVKIRKSDMRLTGVGRTLFSDRRYGVEGLAIAGTDLYTTVNNSTELNEGESLYKWDISGDGCKLSDTIVISGINNGYEIDSDGTSLYGRFTHYDPEGSTYYIGKYTSGGSMDWTNSFTTYAVGWSCGGNHHPVVVGGGLYVGGAFNSPASMIRKYSLGGSLLWDSEDCLSNRVCQYLLVDADIIYQGGRHSGRPCYSHWGKLPLSGCPYSWNSSTKDYALMCNGDSASFLAYEYDGTGYVKLCLRTNGNVFATKSLGDWKVRTAGTGVYLDGDYWFPVWDYDLVSGFQARIAQLDLSPFTVTFHEITNFPMPQAQLGQWNNFLYDNGYFYWSTDDWWNMR
ncbi:hypothetical protein ES703_82426 [subsurface metagenome]